MPAKRNRAALYGEIAPILADAVRAAGGSQGELGSAADVSQSQVSKYLRGVRVPDINVLDDLCTALDLDTSEIIAEAITRRSRR